MVNPKSLASLTTLIPSPPIATAGNSQLIEANEIRSSLHLLIFNMTLFQLDHSATSSAIVCYIYSLLYQYCGKMWRRQWTIEIFKRKQECYHQFLNDNVNSPVLLTAQINDFFTRITHEFETLTQVQTPPNVISSDLLVSMERGFIWLTYVAKIEGCWIRWNFK